jgi:Integrase core domain
MRRHDLLTRQIRRGSTPRALDEPARLRTVPAFQARIEHGYQPSDDARATGSKVSGVPRCNPSVRRRAHSDAEMKGSRRSLPAGPTARSAKDKTCRLWIVKGPGDNCFPVRFLMARPHLDLGHFTAVLRCDNGPRLANALRRWRRFSRKAAPTSSPARPDRTDTSSPLAPASVTGCSQSRCSAVRQSVKAIVEDFRDDYNEHRPHSALQMAAPAPFAHTWKLQHNPHYRSIQRPPTFTAGGPVNGVPPSSVTPAISR